MLRFALWGLGGWLLTTVALAENWPGWRGPRGDGTSLESEVPTHWNHRTGENIAWSVPIPGNSHASPIVWKDRIFLVNCDTDTCERQLLCLDLAGKMLWKRTVVQSPLETKHALNSYASGTPVTDGERIYVTFLHAEDRTVPAPNVGAPRPINPGNIVVAAYNYEGKQLWRVSPGSFVSAHGFCSCPVLFRELLILNGDHDGDSYVVALQRDTGEEVWRVSRKHKTRSYVTPLIREVAGQMQMVFSGSKCIVSLDPQTGRQLWEIDGPTEQFVASMVYDGRLFYMSAGFPTYHVMGIRPDGQGNVTNTHVAWHVKNARCYVPSPVVVDKYLLVADDRGTANCFNTADGTRVWQERLGKHYSASLVTANGLVYFLADDGITKVIKPGPELEVVAENSLGEYCYASPAIADGSIYIRGEKKLYCIQQTDQDTQRNRAP